jgi:hypothetical protein
LLFYVGFCQCNRLDMTNQCTDSSMPRLSAWSSGPLLGPHRVRAKSRSHHFVLYRTAVYAHFKTSKSSPSPRFSAMHDRFRIRLLVPGSLSYTRIRFILPPSGSSSLATVKRTPIFRESFPVRPAPLRGLRLLPHSGEQRYNAELVTHWAEIQLGFPHYTDNREDRVDCENKKQLRYF